MDDQIPMALDECAFDDVSRAPDGIDVVRCRIFGVIAIDNPHALVGFAESFLHHFLLVSDDNDDFVYPGLIEGFQKREDERLSTYIQESFRSIFGEIAHSLSDARRQDESLHKLSFTSGLFIGYGTI